MSQRQWIVIIGVWVMVFLFLGFPSSWEKAFAILTGLVIILFAYRIKFKENTLARGSSFTDSALSSSSGIKQEESSKDQIQDPSPYQNPQATPDVA
jgi:cell division protein FtsW (lipid II flippase)